jgi:putative ABC transport system ATP-binding protein
MAERILQEERQKLVEADGNGLIIDTKAVTKVYGMGEIQIHALDGVDVHVKPGEWVSIMGPSGSGKSTLMNILGGLDRPTNGQYILDGEDVSELNREQLAHIRNQKLGFIFQSYNLLPKFTAIENVIVPLLYEKVKSRDRKRRIEKAEQMLELVGLADRMQHVPQELSGGQQQRVAIARALINDPVLILADEPTGNLDSKSGLEIMNVLRELNGSGRTIVMVTHDPEIADQTQRVVHLLDGKIEKDYYNGKHEVGV